MTVELPKTESSEAAVPVIKPLRRILDAWKAKAEVTDGCWIFQAGFTRKKDHPEALLDAAKMTPLSPANILRDVVLPALVRAGRHRMAGLSRIPSWSGDKPPCSPR